MAGRSKILMSCLTGGTLAINATLRCQAGGTWIAMTMVTSDVMLGYEALGA
jgi:hypothetical protein